MKTRSINNQQINAIGLGCMGMSWAYGPTDEQENLAVLDRAIELGVTHWDSADIYGAGENEKLLARSLKKHRDSVFLVTKFGNVYDRSMTSHQDQVAANVPWIVDGSPAYARKCLELSLERLEVDSVDLYYLHRIDAKVPIEDSIGEMAKFVEEGKAKAIGISEASAETIRKAHAVHPIAAVQSELSLWTRDYLDEVVPLCAELGITFVAYSPLGRGFLTGKYKSVDDFAETDWRRKNPRFAGEAFSTNLAITSAVEEIASAKGVSAGNVALAWVLAQGEHIVTIPGTKRLKYLEENAQAGDVVLTPDEIARLNSLQPPVGDRYESFAMGHLNI